MIYGPSACGPQFKKLPTPSLKLSLYGKFCIFWTYIYYPISVLSYINDSLYYQLLKKFWSWSIFCEILNCSLQKKNSSNNIPYTLLKISTVGVYKTGPKIYETNKNLFTAYATIFHSSQQIFLYNLYSCAGQVFLATRDVHCHEYTLRLVVL